MVHIDWYGPPSGNQSVEHIVSYSVPVASGLIRYSSKLKSEASNILAMTHHREGEERSEIGVIHNGQSAHEYSPDLDSIVYLQAPDDREREGKKREVMADAFAAAESIEFGHTTKSGKRVKGVSPLRKAARTMAANPKLSIK